MLSAAAAVADKINLPFPNGHTGPWPGNVTIQLDVAGGSPDEFAGHCASLAAALRDIPNTPVIVSVGRADGLDVIGAYRILVATLDQHDLAVPILLRDQLPTMAEPAAGALITASTNIGALLADGIGDAVEVTGEPELLAGVKLAYNILQAAGARTFKTDYVACPSCGRTLFNLQTVTARIKTRTAHLKGVKIAIMGCIVNGPGEMADADFGYVGTAPGRVSLWVGKKQVKHHIPEEQAVDELIGLIREHGRWTDPPGAPTPRNACLKKHAAHHPPQCPRRREGQSYERSRMPSGKSIHEWDTGNSRGIPSRCTGDPRS